MSASTILLLLMSAQAAPSLAGIERLSPQAAGDTALEGLEHGPIATVRAPDVQGIHPPGLVRREMVEQAVAQAGGCTRKRWTVTFLHGPDGSKDSATLDDRSVATEVALADSRGCPDDNFVKLGSGINLSEAFAALKHLDWVRLHEGAVTFSCSDKTKSGLCAGSRTIRRELARISPWAVMRRGDTTMLWLGKPGQIVTEVRYSSARPERIMVEREVPAPF